MNPKTVHRRLVRRFESAKDMISKQRCSVRATAKMHRIPRSTLADAINRDRKGIFRKKQGGQPAFSKEDEELLIGTVERFADHGILLTRAQFKEVMFCLWAK